MGHVKGSNSSIAGVVTLKRRVLVLDKNLNAWEARAIAFRQALLRSRERFKKELKTKLVSEGKICPNSCLLLTKQRSMSGVRRPKSVSLPALKRPEDRPHSAEMVNVMASAFKRLFTQSACESDLLGSPSQSIILGDPTSKYW